MEPLSLNFCRNEPDTLVISLAGDWKRENRLRAASEVEKQLEIGPQTNRIFFKTENLTGWDSMLLTFLIWVRALVSINNITLEEDNLPEGVQRLLALASAVPERKLGKKEQERIPLLARFGE